MPLSGIVNPLDDGSSIGASGSVLEDGEGAALLCGMV